MPEAAVVGIITGAIGAGSATVGAIQNADAQGEQQKQQAAQQSADDALLASQQQQEANMKQDETNDTARDAQLTQEQQTKEQQGLSVSPDSSYSGPSVFGSTGYAVSSKGSGLFGGI